MQVEKETAPGVTQSTETPVADESKNESAAIPTAETSTADPTQPAKDVASPSKPAAPKEKWLIYFDVNAFEEFCEAFPEVIEPGILQVRKFVHDFIDKIDIAQMRVK